ncbi:VOC family protein [Paenibacillus puldeungensis]|uniref:VOC family protein n=1 Tax=Paenibacillus puldeungensis TaxID=696536 RepID=A0ABW3RVF3_9BACL
MTQTVTFIFEERKGQAFELNFECNSPEDVYARYDDFVSKGATGITAPKVTSWGHTTGFFADPEGNIHSLFAVNPATAENPKRCSSNSGLSTRGLYAA